MPYFLMASRVLCGVAFVSPNCTLEILHELGSCNHRDRFFAKTDAAAMLRYFESPHDAASGIDFRPTILNM
jgi:hypothetical protein